MRVYYGLDLLLSKLGKAQSSGKFRERHSRLSCFAFPFFRNGQVRFASLDSQFNINFLRFAMKIIFFLSNLFASLQKFFSYCSTCLLCFVNNFLTVERVRFDPTIIFLLSDVFASLRNNFLTTEPVRFALKTIFFLSNVFASLRK